MQSIGLIQVKKDYSGDIKVFPPSKILAILKEKEFKTKQITNTLSDVLPDLLTSFYLDNQKPVNKLYQGVFQLKMILEEALIKSKTNDLWYQFGEGNDFYSFVSEEYLTQFINSRVKKNIHVKLIARPESDFAKTQQFDDKKLLRQTKFLKPSQNISLGVFSVIGSKVVIWNTVAIEAFVIENIVIAKFMCGIYDLIWEGLS